jgi:DNA-nicking Smr family endonuclease
VSRRRATEEERALFEASFTEARPMKVDSASKTRAKPVPLKAKPATTSGGLDGRTSERMRRGLLEPSARLDLHGYTEAEAHRALLSFLRNAQRSGDKLVLVVTGKGAPAVDGPFDMGAKPRGVLKTMVPRWLREPAFAALLAGARAAHRKHGGAGAMYLYLRKP